MVEEYAQQLHISASETGELWWEAMNGRAK
jgi:hypothetical protein